LIFVYIFHVSLIYQKPNTMKIYRTYKECLAAAQLVLTSAPQGSFIDEGSYKGGRYDCMFILHPLTGKALFEGAYK
jgi:hypothetical protein